MKKFNYIKDIKKNKIQWCLSCGNYSILFQLIKTFQKLKLNKKKVILISGIGCSSRLPYYIKNFGIHTLHGRSLPIATGLKLSNPKFNIWVISGDGDSFSIGLNHLLHTIRKNINLKILIFNNGIYALTKGQKSLIDYNFNSLSLILSAGCNFVARSIDNNPKHLKKIFEQANKHIGTSYIEILQNCPIYNKKKEKKIIYIKNKKPLIYDNKKKCLIFKKKFPYIYNKKKINKKKIWIHNQKNLFLSYILSNFNILNKKLPIPLGIIYKKKIKIKKKKNKKTKKNLFYKKNFLF